MVEEPTKKKRAVLLARWAIVSACRLFIILPLFFLTFSLSLPTRVSAQNYQADQVKAALLFKFAKLIGWSDEVQRRDRFTFGVLGDPAFASTLSALVEGKSISGREIEVLEFASPEQVKPCHVLYFSNDSASHMSALSKRIGSGVVFVGDGAEVLNQGGVIAFLIKDERFRFALSARNALRYQVVLSRELKSLAETIVE